jgi:hypothetical protein
VNVLSEEKKQQVIALGRLGWSLRRIQSATRIRRETAAGYLKAAGIPVRRPGGWGRQEPKPAIEVSTDPGAENRPPGTASSPGRSPSASACEPYREIIESALAKGRNAIAIYQDLVDGHGFGVAAGLAMGRTAMRTIVPRLHLGHWSGSIPVSCWQRAR